MITVIDVSWKDAKSSMKAISSNGSLSHKYTLTEALFILHLKPSTICNDIWYTLFQKNKYEDDNILFYAKCLTGALGCVLKYEKRVASDFTFELLQTDDTKTCFIRNIKKLMQEYKDKNWLDISDSINLLRYKFK